ncbi:hypothetical protein [Rhodococcus sp. X156]|uniref:hypothetical protein n=1 Tax=Rhodococcus sp. X156 TaxID=2499145 RepID=UPI000FDCBDCC|nr:hypothetical protein [Rhodococcus sp. X156]
MSAPALVVGVDVLSETLREVDEVADHVRRLLEHAPGTAVVATHLSRCGPVPHLTVSVALPGADPEAVWRGGVAAVRQRWPRAAVCCGPRSTGPSSTSGGGSVLAAAQGVAAHVGRTSGRLVQFPGSLGLTGTVPLARVVAQTAVDRVEVLGAPCPDDVLLRTREHVRPTWRGGELVLVVEHAAGGVLVPFESPTPTPCCADH